MTTDQAIEDRLAHILGQGMTSAQRTWLDRRMSASLATPGRAGGVRRWRVGGRALLLVVVLLVLAPSVFLVGASIVSTEAPYGMGDASDYVAELDAAKAVTPIPPNATWPPYLAEAPDPNAAYGTGLGRAMVEYNAHCLWLGYWYDAHERGDLPAVATAVGILEDVRTWRTFTDPLTSDEGFREGSRRTIDAAIAGDASVVLEQLRINCTGTWEE